MVSEDLLLLLVCVRMFGDLVPPIHYIGLSAIEPESCASADAGAYCEPIDLEAAREFHLPRGLHQIAPEGSIRFFAKLSIRFASWSNRNRLCRAYRAGPGGPN